MICTVSADLCYLLIEMRCRSAVNGLDAGLPEGLDGQSRVLWLPELMTKTLQLLILAS